MELIVKTLMSLFIVNLLAVLPLMMKDMLEGPTLDREHAFVKVTFFNFCVVAVCFMGGMLGALWN